MKFHNLPKLDVKLSDTVYNVYWGSHEIVNAIYYHRISTASGWYSMGGVCSSHKFQPANQLFHKLIENNLPFIIKK
jgi:hypothetical protein